MRFSKLGDYFFLMKTGNKSKNWFLGDKRNAFRGKKATKFFCPWDSCYFLLSQRPQQVHIELIKPTLPATWTASVCHSSTMGRFESTFVNHPSIVFSFNLLWHHKICIANVMQSDATNRIRYTRNFLFQCIRKQTIKSPIFPMSCLKSHKRKENNRKAGISRIFDGTKQLRKKGIIYLRFMQQ